MFGAKVPTNSCCGVADAWPPFSFSSFSSRTNLWNPGIRGNSNSRHTYKSSSQSQTLLLRQRNHSSDLYRRMTSTTCRLSLHSCRCCNRGEARRIPRSNHHNHRSPHNRHSPHNHHSPHNLNHLPLWRIRRGYLRITLSCCLSQRWTVKILRHQTFYCGVWNYHST